MDFTFGELDNLGEWEVGVLSFEGLLVGGLNSHFSEDREFQWKAPWDKTWVPGRTSPANRAAFPEFFLPLLPGLNVAYGLNGSGKTRLLNTIVQLARGDHGPCEGLVFSTRSSVTGNLCDMPSSLDVHRPAWYGGGGQEEGCVSTSGGMNRAICDEFLSLGSLLLARPITNQPEERMCVVPFCPPGIRGPITRAALSQMRDQWDTQREVLAPLRKTFYEDQLHGGPGEEKMQSLSPALDREWRTWNEDSILYNTRNLGPEILRHDPELSSYDEPYGYLSFPFSSDEPSHPRMFDEDQPLFLPPIGWLSHGYGWPDSVRVSPNWERQPEALDRTLQTTRSHVARFWRASSEPAELFARSTMKGEQQDASTLLRTLLPGSPELRLEVGDPEDWLLDRAPRWTLGGFPLDWASKAQRRWACFSIETTFETTHMHKSGWDLVLLDEPEDGLHRSAEDAIARALSNPGTPIAKRILVTSHSPAFLNAPGANLVHLSRQAGPRAWRLDDYDSLVQLGLSAGDLLARQRLFLAVEGAHDKAVFETLFEGRLRELGVTILALRGASHVEATLDSQFLFDCTDASVMTLVDNLAADTVRSVWSSARTTAQRGDVAGATKTILRGLTGKAPERKWMREFLPKAISAGKHERVEVHGLSEPDIIFYLPPKFFVRGHSWDRVKSDWNDYLQKPGAKHRDVKSWIASVYGTDTSSPKAFAEAARALDVPPADFAGLIRHIEQVVSGA